mgnify:FL=1
MLYLLTFFQHNFRYQYCNERRNLTTFSILYFTTFLCFLFFYFLIFFRIQKMSQHQLLVDKLNRIIPTLKANNLKDLIHDLNKNYGFKLPEG